MKRKMKSRILIACFLFGIISVTGCKGEEEKSADFIIMSTENENNTQENKNSDTAEKNVATTLLVEGKAVKATTYKDKSGFSVASSSGFQSKAFVFITQHCSSFRASNSKAIFFDVIRHLNAKSRNRSASSAIAGVDMHNLHKSIHNYPLFSS